MSTSAPAASGSTPVHTDAIGFLRAFQNDEDLDWFTKICDLSVSGDTLDTSGINDLLALFTGKASYISQPIPAAAAAFATASPSTSMFLEKLSDFKNFKGLGGTLQADFKKQITIVFGANGSGKSSLCEAFKILASQDKPSNPLHNVKSNPPLSSPSQFNFKFRTDRVPQTWTTASGFGTKAKLIKYFDAGIAIRNVKDSIDPGRVIALSPFKLDVFQKVSQHINSMKQAAEQYRAQDTSILELKLNAINALFKIFPVSYFATVAVNTAGNLPDQVAAIVPFTEQTLLSQKQQTLQDFLSASSAEGMGLLKTHNRELEKLCRDIGKIISNLESATALLPAQKSIQLEQATSAQELLAKALIPEGRTAQDFFPFLRAAAELCNFEALENESCPLCKRELKKEQFELFNKYHELLTDTTSSTIRSVSGEIDKAKGFYNAAKAINRQDWEKITAVASDALKQVQELAETLVDGCEATLELPDSLQEKLAELKKLHTELEKSTTDKKNLIELAEQGRSDMSERAGKLRDEIAELEYKKELHTRLADLKSAAEVYDQYHKWETPINSLASFQRRATGCSKNAYTSLVVSGFETRLNSEYLALTERPMASFGVTLANEARQQTLKVNPQVGGESIAHIFSEGEQRVHALALFFAELDTAPQKVIVFDDPSTSFDYNFIAGYCERIRDFVRAHPDKQVIVLSHHWEFFVQLQTVLNSAIPSLNGKLNIQVLEDASSIAEYSEDIDTLKADIENVLNQTGEPSKEDKSKTAGKMRRLMEAVVNTHVFAGQRHQFKQKNQAVGKWNEFMKVTPLLPAEAQTLAELFSKLSMTEHDDPRNAYTVIAKAVFQTRYDEIKNIEAAVIARKP